jgi:EpsI family protein
VSTRIDVDRSRRKFLVGGLAVTAAVVAGAAKPRKKLSYLGRENIEDVVPPNIGHWALGGGEGLVVPPEDQLENALYSQLLTRVYFDGQNPPIMLLAAYSQGQTGILQIHRPEVCYPAGGFHLSPIVPRELQVAGTTIPVNSLTASADGMVEHILYWTRIGNDLPLSWRDQRLAVAEANFRGFIPDALLLRISTRRPDRARALSVMEEFARELVLSVAPQRRAVLIGRPV